MSCSTCNKWDTCDKATNGNCLILVKSCFDGKIVSVDKVNVARYIKLHPKRWLRNAGIVVIKAEQKGDRLFRLRCLKNIKSCGSKYNCEYGEIQAYYQGGKAMYSIYENGCDYSMSKASFEAEYGIGVSENIFKHPYSVEYFGKSTVADNGKE